jgi:uncharacterized NAD-dependent epimerase/dehydratase family protein
VAAVIDSMLEGQDAGVALDGVARDVPIAATLAAALEAIEQDGRRATHFVIGMAPDGGELDGEARRAVLEAIDAGLNVDAGLHSFLNDDEELCAAAFSAGVKLRDVRRPPARSELHFFSGKIAEVDSLIVAVLGTDPAVGKRTTAFLLADGLVDRGFTAEVIGTGQTAWMQGARHGIILDSLVNDFVAGELEHAVWSAWSELRPHVILVEGQGSLMHPAYPGGFEILAATRPRGVILQHALARLDYDGFPGFEIPSVERHIAAIELISPARAIGVSINAERLESSAAADLAARLAERTGLPTVDPVTTDIAPLVEAVLALRDEAPTA